jgi:threonine dehydrogenase-like Zn-dependent dehydrogenase
MPWRDAVFAPLLCTALHALDRAGVEEGRAGAASALVLGGGLVGQLLARAARMRGLRVVLEDPNPARAGLAGAAAVPGEAPPGRFDIVFLALSGQADAAFARAVAALPREPGGRPCGRIVVVGRIDLSLAFSVELGNIDLANVAHCGFGYRSSHYVEGRIDLRPPPGQSLVDENLRRAVAAIASGAVDVSRLHTHTFPRAEAAAAYRLLAAPLTPALGVAISHE